MIKGSSSAWFVSYVRYRWPDPDHASTVAHRSNRHTYLTMRETFRACYVLRIMRGVKVTNLNSAMLAPPEPSIEWATMIHVVSHTMNRHVRANPFLHCQAVACIEPRIGVADKKSVNRVMKKTSLLHSMVRRSHKVICPTYELLGRLPRESAKTCGPLCCRP